MGKKDIIGSLRAFRKDAGKEFGFEHMILFGSAARGEMKEDSDIDILLVSEKFRGKKFFKRAIPLYDHWKLELPVDFLCYTPEEFNRLKRQVTIVKEAVEEGIEIN